VASGLSDIVLVGGVEKMTDGADATYALASASDREYEAYHGITFPGLYAMIARLHMHKYGTTREQIAMVAVKNHSHGILNPNAQFPREITLETVLGATPVADPLTILDCSPISDGAASVILCPLEMAKKKTDTPVLVAGSGFATDTIALHQRKDPTVLNAVTAAAKSAYDQSKTDPTAIDLAEVHDCFTIAEICVVEDLGFVKKGDGGKAMEAGTFALGGKLPVNTSGGLKSKGHPVGATGVAQAVEAFRQLRGEAGKRQVKNAKTALIQNMGGSGGSSVVHVLRLV
jgi:acetyl-CoA C-acetyltransferase